MSNFWDEISFNDGKKTAGLDFNIDPTQSVYSLSDKAQTTKKQAKLPAGISVTANLNIGRVPPTTMPKQGTVGEIVSVKTATGETTELDGEVFVRWNGRARIDRVAKEFLIINKTKTASEDLSSLYAQPLSMAEYKEAFAFNAGAKQADLVHMASEDLWELGVDEKGEYAIERLFDDNGDPLKV